MMNQEGLDDLWKQLTQRKAHEWEVHGERDMEPMLVCGWRDAGTVDANLHLFCKLLGNQQRMGSLIAMAAYAMVGGEVEVDGKILTPPAGMVKVEAGDRLEEVWFASETYARTFDSQNEVSDAKVTSGDLAEDFRNNPASEVVEELQMVIWSDDLVGGVDTQIVRQQFTFGDGGVLNWGDCTTPDLIEGDVHENVLSLFKEYT